MRKYWMHYYRPFANNIRFYYTENQEEEKKLPKDVMRVSRKSIEKMIRNERFLRKIHDGTSGFTDAYIFPVDCDDDWMNNSKYNVHDCIVEKS